jgi:DMSO/TMAO reductase YedYZ molybdopterin-dependent catalytic subunit
MTIVPRRAFLAGAAVSLVPAAVAGKGGSVLLPFANGARPLVRLPQKRPMIGLTSRPPQLETPFEVFNEGLLTPNDAFFVRYHLAGLPGEIDPATFRLSIGGHVDAPLSLSLTQLRRDFPASEVVAVNQCSGNSRGFVEPRVGGGQLGNGAMGNARWTGVSLKALLDRAGLRSGARQVTFNGLDNPPSDGIPDFVKALDIDHARNGDVLVAYAMNGAPLPFLNGYPLRLVVPGYYGTYWVKHLDQIDVVDAEFDGYWMKSAYRIPDNACACVAPGTKPERTRPIGRLNIRSFVTSHRSGQKLDRAGTALLRGIAFNGGEGIARVMVSADGGATWLEARLGDDLGGFSFREWKLPMALASGRHEIKVRAFGRDGTSQPLDPLWQPSGYMRNVVETVALEVA